MNITMDYYNNYRFDLLVIETIEEEIKRKSLEKERLLKESKKIKRAREKDLNYCCEGCGTDEYVRWCHEDEFFLCSECFIHDLQCQADVMVPIHRVEHMDGYNEYLSWDVLWEEEVKERSWGWIPGYYEKGKINE